MPRFRRGYRRYHSYTSRSLKYSNETYSSNFQLSQTTNHKIQNNVVVVPSASILGTRKVKNFTLRINVDPAHFTNDDSFGNLPVFFALVFVPEGTDPSAIGFGDNQNATTFYEPNQNVIISGIAEPGQIYSFKSRLARNLNSNDKIYLCICTPKTNAGTGNYTIPIAFTLNYALGY